MGKHGRVSVYIVEDNSLYTYFLNEALREEGDFSITTYETAQQALDALKDGQPDVLILDYHLDHGLNGLDIFKEIHLNYPKLPVIVLSSQEDIQVVADLMEAGVQEYIQKKDKDVVDKLKKAIIHIAHKTQNPLFTTFWKRKIENKSIFIVEDNKTYAKALEMYLKTSFPDVEEVKYFPVGEVALMELERRNPSIIIMDYFLADKYYDAETGISAIKEIKSKKPDTNIILLSSQSEINVAIEATKTYHCHYVRKDHKAFGKVESYIKGVW